jgi:hypothetical protein
MEDHVSDPVYPGHIVPPEPAPELLPVPLPELLLPELVLVPLLLLPPKPPLLLLLEWPPLLLLELLPPMSPELLAELPIPELLLPPELELPALPPLELLAPAPTGLSRCTGGMPSVGVTDSATVPPNGPPNGLSPPPLQATIVKTAAAPAQIANRRWMDAFLIFNLGPCLRIGFGRCDPSLQARIQLTPNAPKRERKERG